MPWDRWMSSLPITGNIVRGNLCIALENRLANRIVDWIASGKRTKHAFKITNSKANRIASKIANKIKSRLANKWTKRMASGVASKIVFFLIYIGIDHVRTFYTLVCCFQNIDFRNYGEEEKWNSELPICKTESGNNKVCTVYSLVPKTV